MQVEIYQWLVPIICLFFIVRTVRQYIRRRRHMNSMFIWVGFWVLIILVAVIPNPVSFKLANLLGIKDNVNAIIFMGLGILYFLLFQVSSAVTRLESQVTELVRKIAKDQAMDKMDEE